MKQMSMWKYITEDERRKMLSLIDRNICDECRANHNFEDDDTICEKCDVMEIIEIIYLI